MVSTSADDQELVAACRAGNRQAFRTLYERYQRRVYAVALGYLRNQEDALDVVQEAFIRVHRHLPGFEGNSSFYTWLYRIVANLCIDQLRRGRNKRDLEFDDGIRHDNGTQAAAFRTTLPIGNPADAVQNREILAAVQDSIKHLSDNHRTVLVMRELQGLSYSEMADVMQCSKGTIMSRLFHARRNMQRLLEERLGAAAIPSGPAERAKSESAEDESGLASEGAT